MLAGALRPAEPTLTLRPETVLAGALLTMTLSTEALLAVTLLAVTLLAVTLLAVTLVAAEAVLAMALLAVTLVAAEALLAVALLAVTLVAAEALLTVALTAVAHETLRPMSLLAKTAVTAEALCTVTPLPAALAAEVVLTGALSRDPLVRRETGASALSALPELFEEATKHLRALTSPGTARSALGLWGGAATAFAAGGRSAFAGLAVL